MTWTVSYNGSGATPATPGDWQIPSDSPVRLPGRSRVTPLSIEITGDLTPCDNQFRIGMIVPPMPGGTMVQLASKSIRGANAVEAAKDSEQGWVVPLMTAGSHPIRATAGCLRTTGGSEPPPFSATLTLYVEQFPPTS